MKKKIKSIIFIGLTLLMLSNCKKTKDSIVNSPISNYDNYNKLVDKNVSALSPERKNQRNKWINDMARNPIYISLVDSVIVAENYLPVLTAVSDAIRNTYSEKGESMFGISNSIAEEIEKSENGKEKMDFILAVSSLSINKNGGMPKELVSVFERYRTKFNLYGNKGDLVADQSGNSINITSPYNISFAFALFNPNEKEVLNAIYESIQNKNAQWLPQDDYVYDNEFMVLKTAYMKHLKNVYPDSEYLVDADFEITPEELYASYNSNEVAADEKYKNKKLAITGVISDIGKDILNDPYISFKIDYLQSVTCYFSKDEIKKIAKLNKGETITVIGKCGGLILTNVIIKDCVIY